MCACILYILYGESRLQKSGGPRLILPEKMRYLSHFFFVLTDADNKATITIYDLFAVTVAASAPVCVAAIVSVHENPVERKTRGAGARNTFGRMGFCRCAL